MMLSALVREASLVVSGGSCRPSRVKVLRKETVEHLTPSKASASLSSKLMECRSGGLRKNARAEGRARRQRALASRYHVASTLMSSLQL